MPMNRKQKSDYIQEIKELATTSSSIVAIYYSKLSSMQMHNLRVQARELSVRVKVSKNTLTRMALSDSQYSKIADDMKGHVLLLFAQSAPGSAAKLVQNLIKQQDFVSVCSIGLTGERIAASQLDQIAALPDHKEALSMLMRAMSSPVRALATVTQETYASLVRALNQVAEQKSKQ